MVLLLSRVEGRHRATLQAHRFLPNFQSLIAYVLRRSTTTQDTRGRRSYEWRVTGRRPFLVDAKARHDYLAMLCSVQSTASTDLALTHIFLYHPTSAQAGGRLVGSGRLHCSIGGPQLLPGFYERYAFSVSVCIVGPHRERTFESF